MKKNIVKFLSKLIKSIEYKQLRIIYLIAFVFSVIITFCKAGGGGDMESYYTAKDLILSGSLDILRTPLYPLFLAITKHRFVTIAVQWLIFFVSIGFLYKTLENIKISSRLVFLAMIIYVCHPIFTLYQYQRIPEALCISLGSMFAYYLVTFIKTKKISYCWIFHAIILCMFLLKPGCIFLLAVPIMLLFYLFFTKRNLILSYILPFSLVLLLIGSYGFAIKKTYNVFSFSSVSDINLYWMLRERNKINPDLIENEAIKNFVSDKINIEYDRFTGYYDEADTIIKEYGWKELHNVVQTSLGKNQISILFDKQNLKKIKENLDGFVGRSVDNFKFKKPYFDPNYFPYFNFYALVFILIFYFALIVKQIYKLRAIPIISILFLVCIVANFGTIVLTAPNNYGRLIVPSIPIILIVCTQCFEWLILFIQRKEKQFKLIC